LKRDAYPELYTAKKHSIPWLGRGNRIELKDWKQYWREKTGHFNRCPTAG
jgi:hypothetical protein